MLIGFTPMFRRFLAAPLPLLAASLVLSCLTTHASAARRVSRVRLIVAGRELASKAAPVADETEVYAPLEVLKEVGAAAQLSPHGDTVLVTEKSTGRSLELALARVNGAEMVALSDLGHIIDGVVVRAPRRQSDRSAPATVYFLARIVSADVSGSRLSVSTSFPVRYKVDARDGGRWSSLDCIGASTDGFRSHIRGGTVLQSTLDTARIVVPVDTGMAIVSTDSRDVAVTQFSGEIARLPQVAVVTPLAPAASRLAVSGTMPLEDTSADALMSGSARAPTLRAQLPGGKAAAAAVQPALQPGLKGAPQHDTTRMVDSSAASRNVSRPQNVVAGDGVRFDYPTPASVADMDRAVPTRPSLVKPVEITGVNFVTDNTSRARIEVKLSGKAAPAVRYVPGSTQMEIDIPNAILSLPGDDNGERSIQHPLVSRVAALDSPARPGSVRIEIDTTRIVGYTLYNKPDGVSLELRVPRNASGALSDKLIVVDAGHGGGATGASGHGAEGTVYEKNITLAIAMKLRAALEQAGARVVVTRDADIDVPLYDRPRLANTIGADLFISIHNDSSPHNNSASGTTTYYHGGDSSSRALAQCVQDSVHAVTGLPSRGAQSDSILYASGLAVLRNSTMPAVLCEVAYINNGNDRAHLLNPVFQQRVAQAMCEGLRSYVEGRPAVVAEEDRASASNREPAAMGRLEPTH